MRISRNNEGSMDSLFRTFIILFLLVSPLQVKAQVFLKGNYYWTHVNQSVGIGPAITKKKADFFCQLHYNVNTFIKDNQEYTFRHRFKADGIQHIAISAGIDRYFLSDVTDLHPYLLFRAKGSYMHLHQLFNKIDTETVYMPNPQQVLVIRQIEKNYPPAFVFESYFGIGVNICAYKSWFVSAEIGIGGMYYFDPSLNLYPTIPPRYFEFADYYSLGLQYALK